MKKAGRNSLCVTVRRTHLPDSSAEGHGVHLIYVDAISGPSGGFFMHLQHRTYSKSFKAQVIQEYSEPGASIANIALGYSLNAKLVHKWIRLYQYIHAKIGTLTRKEHL